MLATRWEAFASEVQAGSVLVANGRPRTVSNHYDENNKIKITFDEGDGRTYHPDQLVTMIVGIGHG